jgi:hypothetical protein
MTIETTIKSRQEEVTLITKEGVEFNLPVSLIPANINIGETVWLTIDLTPPTDPSPKDILNELLGSDQYEEAV